MSNNAQETFQKSAFGTLVVEEPTPVVQLNFNYNINEELIRLSNNNGTSSIENNMLKLSTGAAANQSAVLNSRAAIKYGSGQGVHFRTSGIFTTGVVGSNQFIGAGDSGDALLFGYQGDTFGILRRSGGLPEAESFQVTTASTTAENITVTLDGDSDATVAVTNSGNVTTTANEIAAHDFSGLGRGWDVHVKGDTVIFLSYDSAPHAGAYSITATTAVVTISQQIAGVAPIDDFIAQTDPTKSTDGVSVWNKDKADNSDTLPIMDWTMGNVFQIQYQWLGFGVLNFLVEEPTTGDDILVHQIIYPNANTMPSLANPNLQLCTLVENVSNTTDMIVRVGSMGGFIEGKSTGSHFHNGKSSIVTVGVATETPILSIHNRRMYSGMINKIRIRLIFAGSASDGNKSVVVRQVKNATLTNASFLEVEPGVSIIEFDSAATVISGGDEQLASGLAKVDSGDLDMSTMSYFLDPGDTLTVTGESSSANEVLASLTWEELF